MQQLPPSPAFRLARRRAVGIAALALPALWAVEVLGADAPSPLPLLLRLAGYGSLLGLGLWLGQRRVREEQAEQRRNQEVAADELRQSERRRERSERMALVGQLATGVTHEIRNPLNVALIQVDLLERAPATAEAKERLASVRRSLEHIHQIATDLQVFAHGAAEEPALEWCRPADILEETLRLAELRLKAVARVERSVHEPLPPIHVQRRQLAQVLLNLLVNAADAIEQGPPPSPEIRIEVERLERKVRISVLDNGPGIPAEVMDHLFEPFFTTKAEGKGTGLGLALSREYLARFGGVISAENRPEGGARFVIDLPIDDRDKRAAP